MARLPNVGMIMTKTSYHNVIGGLNDFVWPELKHQKERYRELTKGKFLIVGRKTFEELDEIYSDCTYLVLSDKDPNGIKQIELENVKVFWRVKHLMEYVGESPALVIGGCEVFKRFSRYISYIHLTEVHDEIDGDIIHITNLCLSPVACLSIGASHSFIDYVVKNGPLDDECNRKEFDNYLKSIDRLIFNLI